MSVEYTGWFGMQIGDHAHVTVQVVDVIYGKFLSTNISVLVNVSIIDHIKVEVVVVTIII